MKKTAVLVLWTGGWDSTFRIVELSRSFCSIQPIYVIDPERQSIGYELAAMDAIVDSLRKGCTRRTRCLWL